MSERRPRPDGEPGSGRRGRVAAAIPDALRAIEAKAKPDLKRAVPAVLLAVVFFAVGQRLQFNSGTSHFSIFGKSAHLGSGKVQLVVVGLTLLFLIAGTIATRSVGRELGRVVGLRGGLEAGNAIRLICQLVGYLIVFVGVLSLLRVNFGNLLVGGAVTGVVVGIAAQQTLGNFFAGLVLLFARPYIPGQRVKVRSGSLGGPYVGVILGSGLMYTTIDTDEGPVSLPNAGLLAAAVGPVADEFEDEESMIDPGPGPDTSAAPPTGAAN